MQKKSDIWEYKANRFVVFCVVTRQTPPVRLFFFFFASLSQPCMTQFFWCFKVWHGVCLASIHGIWVSLDRSCHLFLSCLLWRLFILFVRVSFCSNEFFTFSVVAFWTWSFASSPRDSLLYVTVLLTQLAIVVGNLFGIATYTGESGTPDWVFGTCAVIAAFVIGASAINLFDLASGVPALDSPETGEPSPTVERLRLDTWRYNFSYILFEFSFSVKKQ
jgi:hypothetical protein